MERGSARRSSLTGRDRAIVSQTNIGTVSKATLGKLLRDGVVCIMGVSERTAHLAHLELNCELFFFSIDLPPLRMR